MMRPALLVDLDDTLYDERDYVDSGFRHVASLAADAGGMSSADAFAFLQDRLDQDGRGRLFDDLLHACGQRVSPAAVAALVDAYRNHTPRIALADEVRRTLEALRQRFAIAIVTDGLELMQRRKTEALGLVDAVDTIVYCWEHTAPKPGVAAFEIALARLGNPPLAAVVGDDVRHDLPAAVALVAPFVRVRRGRFTRIETPRVPIPVVDVASFCDVPAALAEVERIRTGAV